MPGKKAVAKKAVAKKAVAKKAATRRTPTRPAGPVVPATPTRVGVGDLSKAWDFVETVQPLMYGVHVRRPDDLFVARVRYSNLRLVRGASPRLQRTGSGDALLILELPPQAFGEEAFLDATGPEVPSNPTPPINDDRQDGEVIKERDNSPKTVAEGVPPLPGARIRMARPSRLVFRLPDDVSSVPYTIEGVLDVCRRSELKRPLTARPDLTGRLPPRGEVLTFDVTDLLELVSSADFAESRAALQHALRNVGGEEAVRLVSESASALAGEARDHVTVRAAEPVSSLLGQRFMTATDVLGNRMPQLRDPQVRSLTSAALAFEAASKFAEGLGRRPPAIVDVTQRFPFVTWFLRPYRPNQNDTAIELPYRLVTSPVGPLRFRHRTTPHTSDGRTELWHTRATSATGANDIGPDRPVDLRAVWSEDYPIAPGLLSELLVRITQKRPTDAFFRMPLDPLDRAMLVRTMAGYNEDRPSGDNYLPRPAVARRLVLSALGGLLDSEGNWRLRPATADIEQWRHLATLGRDHYVRVVYAGYLWPFGHAASLVKVTERKFEDSDPSAKKSKRIAVLRQRFFVVVRERVKAFTGARHDEHGHSFPFTSVELLTTVTPNLMDPSNTACRLLHAPGKLVYGGDVAHRMVFWPRTTTGDSGLLRFRVAATDLAGERVTFDVPLLFVGEMANRLVPKNIAAGYNLPSAATRRDTSPIGASVCLAPLNPSAKGDTRLPTQSVRLHAGGVTSDMPEVVNVYPELERATVGIQAIQRLLGRPDAVTDVKYPAVYRDFGFGSANKGEVFLELLSQWSLEFGGAGNQVKSDALGALASPSMMIAGLSRVMGPASDLTKITGSATTPAKFDPASFFGNAKILGGISLMQILKAVDGLTGANVPKFLSKELPAAGGLPARVEASFDWASGIDRPDPLNLLVPNVGGEVTTLAMRGLMSAPIADPSASTFEAEASLNHFKVNLFGFFILHFLMLRFDVKRGQKPDVAVELHPTEGVAFGGPLEFVNKLKDLIPMNGFSDPPALEVTPSGISASFSLNLPSVQVGVFALSNASLGAGFMLPFDARPAEARFNFCTRDRPFSLTVSLLGGGGFFALGIGTDGVREIEAALEFGAALEIDLGVASGSVEIKAGVYFHWLSSSEGDGLVELSGYVRIHGELSVIGLISVSLTFNLQLSYKKQGTRSLVWGEATLTVEVEVLCFSGEVSVKCRREFGGSPSDPTFLDLVPDQPTWSRYCLAFAAE